MKHAERAILFADIVESVRLIEVDEEGVIGRWLDLVAMTKRTVLPCLNGRFIKGLGDGMLLAFSDVQNAVAASFKIHQLAQLANRGIMSERQILLRIGIEYSDVIIEPDDIYGRGVSLAARLVTLAGSGETVVSADVHDRLIPTIDAVAEDLGECYLRHFARPIRAYRVGPPGQQLAFPPMISPAELRPTLAVIPFTPRLAVMDQLVFGDIVAEEVIRNISRSDEINVISRLSTTALHARMLTVTEIGNYLKADYVLNGVFKTDGETITIDAELSESHSEQVIWADRVTGSVAALFEDGQALVERIVTAVSSAVILRELAKLRCQPLPTLRGYTLLLSAITLMHRLSQRDFSEAHRLLEVLIERGSRQAIPHAWLANWHVLKVIQGWSEDLKQDAHLALENSKWALDADPDCSQALAIDGFVHTHLLKRFDIAEERYNLALVNNPSNALARLLRGTMHAFKDQGELAIADTEFAMRLSPLDPHRFIYEAHCAGAHLSAGNFERALELATSSRRANRCHTSTLRILTVTLWELGHRREAQKIAGELLHLDPGLTVSRYLNRSPNADYKIGKRVAHVLMEAGVPV